MSTRRVPFIAKPEAGCLINWGNPITRELACVLLTNERGGYPRDLVTGYPFDQTANGEAPVAPVWTMSRGGNAAIANSGVGYSVGGIPALPSHRAATKVTAVLVVDDTLNNGLGVGHGPVFAVYDGVSTDYTSWAIFTDDGTNTFNGWTFKAGPTNRSAATQHSGAGTGVRATVGAGLHVWGFVVYQVATSVLWDVWADGVYRETVTMTSATLGGNPSNTNIKTYWTASPSPKVVARAFWTRNLSPTDMSRITRSDRAFYNAIAKQPTRRRVIPAAAAGPTFKSAWAVNANVVIQSGVRTA